MAFLNSMNVVASGLSAQKLRLDIVSENVTNSTTTRTENGGAYRRKMVVFEPADDNSFRNTLKRTAAGKNKTGATGGGVIATQIVEDPSEMNRIYDPSHPDADEDGFVEMPNVDMIKEITDAMAATQAYSSNVTAFNTLKTVVSKGLEIGR